MDYNFISVEQFKALEESGTLLESGTYDGMSPDIDNCEVLVNWKLDVGKLEKDSLIQGKIEAITASIY